MAALRWSDTAIDDLYAIRQSLGADAAKRIGRILMESTDCLTDFPARGRPGAGLSHPFRAPAGRVDVGGGPGAHLF